MKTFLSLFTLFCLFGLFHASQAYANPLAFYMQPQSQIYTVDGSPLNIKTGFSTTLDAKNLSVKLNGIEILQRTPSLALTELNSNCYSNSASFASELQINTYVSLNNCTLPVGNYNIVVSSDEGSIQTSFVVQGLSCSSYCKFIPEIPHVCKIKTSKIQKTFSNKGIFKYNNAKLDKQTKEVIQQYFITRRITPLTFDASMSFVINKDNTKLNKKRNKLIQKTLLNSDFKGTTNTQTGSKSTGVKAIYSYKYIECFNQ